MALGRGFRGKVAIVGRELYLRISPLVGESAQERVVVYAYSDYLEGVPDLSVPKGRVGEEAGDGA